MNGFFSMFTGGTSRKMCINCGTNPAFQNYDYCGGACAEWAKNSPPAAGPLGWGQPPPPPRPALGWGGYGSYGAPPQQQGQWSGYGSYPQPPPQAPGPTMCQSCRVKPVFPGHPYCSKTCGASAKQDGGTPPKPSQTSDQMCQNCHTKPVYPGHQYCSKTCGTSAKQGAGPPPMPSQGHGSPPPAYGGYGPPGGQWPQGPPHGWQPQQQGGQWMGPPPQGGQPWPQPPQNWGQGGPPRRNNRATFGGYGDDDEDDWPDEDEEDYDDAPRRPKRAPSSKRGTKMCINCGNNPSRGKSDFCSKNCEVDANSMLGPKRGFGGSRRGPSGGGSVRRRAPDYDDID